jgi:hypothetical protein
MTTTIQQTSTSTSFSDFIRNGSPAEKDRVYSAVLRDTAEAQLRIIKQAAIAPPK